MSLPPLNPAAAALLTRYLLAHENLHTLLSQSDAPEILPLLHFLAHPDITPWLDHYRAIMAHARQNAALNALSDVLRETTDPIQRRLAATALLHNRTPRAPHSARPTKPEAHGSDPWAHAPARRHARTPRHPAPSAPDPSMPEAIPSSGPDAFADVTHPSPQALTHLPIEPPSNQADATQALGLTHLDADLSCVLEEPIDAKADRLDDIGHVDSAEHAEGTGHLDAMADELDRADDLDHDEEEDRDDLENDEDDDDFTHTDDPLLAAALTGDPDAIHRFYIERTGHPPDPILAASLSRALRPPTGPSG